MALRLRQGLTLYFCRHGETEANVERRFQGGTYNSPLTAKGREQSRAIATLLRHEADDISSLDYVSSPLPRARLTMQIVRSGLGLDPKGFTTDRRIVEINLGSWDGKTEAQVRSIDNAGFERRMADKGHVRVPGGGENYIDVAARLESWIGDLKQDTFAVSHGAATRILRGLFQGLSWDEMAALDEKQGVLFRARGSLVERFDTP